jgi:glycosyltransferase involved in cell wall biosynthesis
MRTSRSDPSLPPGQPRSEPGAVLCVANFPSDTAYAWWLMESLWVRVAEAADARGGRTIIAFPQVKQVSPRILEAPATITEAVVPTGGYRPIGEVARFIRRHRIRTIYFTDRELWSPWYLLYRLLGVRSIVVHDHVPGERPPPQPWVLRSKRLLHRAGLLSANLYIGVSDFVRSRLVEVGGVAQEPTVTVRNGVPPARGSARDCREALGLPGNARIVVSCGRAAQYKGIDFMIRCAREVLASAALDDVHFVHFGDGPDMAAFRELVREYNLEGRYILAGFRDDVQELLPSCDVAFHASHGEAFSLAILEFMAAGLPCVAPRHCGNGEAIEDGVSGSLYPPGDLAAAVVELRRLLGDATLARRMGEQARQRASREFTLERMMAEFERVLEPHLRL